MKRVAISLPDEQAAAIEQIRQKKRIPRSRVIQQAITVYLAQQGRTKAIRLYEEGYRRKPEGVEAMVFAAAVAAVLPEEDWE